MGTRFSNLQRIEYIDLAKGICICLVVFNHIALNVGNSNTIFDNQMSLFRMPLYFFLSGLFFKTYGDFCSFFIKKINKLFIPFVSFHFLSSVVWLEVTDVLGGRFSISKSVLYLKSFMFAPFSEQFTLISIWFLWCLFVINLIFFALYKFSHISHYPTILLSVFCIILGLCGFSCGQFNLNFPFYIDTAFTAMPFFLVGYIVKNKTTLLLPSKFDRFIFPVSFLFFVFSYMLAPAFAGYWCNKYEMNILQLYLGGFLGLSAILLLSKRIKKIFFLSYLGRYSIIILVTHPFLFPYIKRLLNPYFSSSIELTISVLILTMISYVVLIPFFVRFFPYITAQKDLIHLK